jgi:hypothetical protein
MNGLKKMWHFYILEFYLAIKKNEICHLQVKDGTGEHHLE